MPPSATHIYTKHVRFATAAQADRAYSGWTEKMAILLIVRVLHNAGKASVLRLMRPVYCWGPSCLMINGGCAERVIEVKCHHPLTLPSCRSVRTRIALLVVGFMTIGAGGTWEVEIACHPDYTSMYPDSEKNTKTSVPGSILDACPSGDGKPSDCCLCNMS